MLSAMTPMTERARGHRFSITAIWYLLGAVAGGVTVGAVLAAGAAGVSIFDLAPEIAAGVLAVIALVTAGSDLRIGPALSIHRRQVNEDWFNAYRRWIYASGFGWQIGNGVTTYTTTACLYLIAGAALLLGDPVAAFGLGVAFGTIRGFAVLLGVPLTNLDAVRRLHSRLDRFAEPSRLLTGAVQLIIALGLSITVSPLLAAVVVLTSGIAVAYRGRSGLTLGPTTDGGRERAGRPEATPAH